MHSCPRPSASLIYRITQLSEGTNFEFFDKDNPSSSAFNFISIFSMYFYHTLEVVTTLKKKVSNLFFESF